MGDGLNRLQAAGLLGNAWAESKFDPKAVGDNGKAFGMFQWHADRWNPFVKWAKSKGVDPWTQGAQISYAIHELGSSEGVAGAKFKMARTTEAAAAAAAAGVRFERPSGYLALRENYTQANGWNERLAATAELYGSVDVNIHTHDGRKQVVNVPIRRISAPAAAGTAPTVKASYPTDQDYR